MREGVGGEGGGEMKCTRKVIRSTFTGQKAGIGDGDTSTCGLFGRVGGSGGGVGGGARQESNPTYLQRIKSGVCVDPAHLRAFFLIVLQALVKPRLLPLQVLDLVLQLQ